MQDLESLEFLSPLHANDPTKRRAAMRTHKMFSNKNEHRVVSMEISLITYFTVTSVENTDSMDHRIPRELLTKLI